MAEPLGARHAQPKTVTTNWRDLDDQAGKRAPGLDAVGAPAAPSEAH